MKSFSFWNNVFFLKFFKINFNVIINIPKKIIFHKKIFKNLMRGYRFKSKEVIYSNLKMSRVRYVHLLKF
jgi:hypothetical protein